MRIIIDRFEGEFAVAELPDGQTVNLPSVLFPDAREGDIFDIVKNQSEADARKKRINEKFSALFED